MLTFAEKHSHVESDPGHLHSNGDDHDGDHDHDTPEVTSKYTIHQIPLQGEESIVIENIILRN